ncbi:hypothetical protein SCUCBS95973_005858 [Sporothrix curviconia]|uniref:Uncharacterized protein n=1 Tax=Sporothrix curviconia TaxID=1260050 RepID=A0ABP0C288_9PEZI
MTTTPSSHEQPITGKTEDGPAGARVQRRVDAPFDLRIDFHALSNHDNMAFFNTTFPGNKGYSFDGLILYIYLSSPHPVVQFFAGVPVIFTPPQRIPHAYPSPMPHGFYVAPRQGSIAGDLNYRDCSSQGPHWQPLFDAIRSHFETIHVFITEVIFWGHFIHIVLRDTDADRAALPFRAAKLICRYLYETEMGRPATLQSETRNRNPNEGQSPDNSEYEVLRPSVRVSSDFLPGTDVYRSSTLGARVHDANGNVFITVAAHTFPTDDALVFHPLRPGGRPIGQLAGRVGTTDVALLSLDPQQRFSNEVFISTSYEKEDVSPQIRGLGLAKQGDIVTLDAPDTGVL